jgi:hypothetical protein
MTEANYEWLKEDGDEILLPADPDENLDDSVSKLINEDIPEVELPEYDPDFDGDANANN